ncbi:DTW domain-containing protein 2 isoform X2 [Chiroxiphia lanceolata]|uniref:DTW domain-containing protein 2 isoform X2 n=1 Tax=Chiroxiphia lanceolata TaxID=296741 RepID=UPI0013CEA143|nr:DTW domain-containing protein 2 isoform X2 [Chiroxiphia lanceolata]
MMSYGLEYPLYHFGSPVPAVSPSNLPPSLPVWQYENHIKALALCKLCSAIAKTSMLSTLCSALIQHTAPYHPLGGKLTLPQTKPGHTNTMYPELATVCRNPNTLILYPGAEATNLEEVAVMSPSSSVMIIIDGTWSQAKDIFYKNSLFRLPKQVQLKTNHSSQYVIRTQPTNTCLSTLECAAVALTIMEKNNSIQETILHPLQALCSFQLQHGAQIHHSKEHLLKNGLYDKPMPKNKRKLRRMELLVNNVKI